MRKTAVLIAAIAAFALILSSTTVFAALDEWSVGSPAGVPGLKLDGDEVVVNIEGTVTMVGPTKIAPNAVGMEIKTENGKIKVWMGPKNFVDGQKLKIKKG